jgi:hypothetical protein
MINRREAFLEELLVIIDGSDPAPQFSDIRKKLLAKYAEATYQKHRNSEVTQWALDYLELRGDITHREYGGVWRYKRS